MHECSKCQERAKVYQISVERQAGVRTDHPHQRGEQVLATLRRQKDTVGQLAGPFSGMVDCRM